MSGNYTRSNLQPHVGRAASAMGWLDRWRDSTTKPGTIEAVVTNVTIAIGLDGIAEKVDHLWLRVEAVNFNKSIKNKHRGIKRLDKVVFCGRIEEYQRKNETTDIRLSLDRSVLMPWKLTLVCKDLFRRGQWQQLIDLIDSDRVALADPTNAKVLSKRLRSELALFRADCVINLAKIQQAKHGKKPSKISFESLLKAG